MNPAGIVCASTERDVRSSSRRAMAACMVRSTTRKIQHGDGDMRARLLLERTNLAGLPDTMMRQVFIAAVAAMLTVATASAQQHHEGAPAAIAGGYAPRLGD